MLKDYKFIGCKKGVGKKSNDDYFALWLGSTDGADVGVSCWNTIFIDEDEFAEFGCCKFGQTVKAQIMNNVLKKFEIIPEKK